MGYLIKNAGKKEVVAAIDSVSNNVPYYCSLTSLEMNKKNGRTEYEQHKPVFTAIEKNIIELICQEKTSDEIAGILFRSPRTIEEHRQKIKGKMNAKTAAGIVLYAIRHRLNPFPKGFASI
jgi:DNA-binding NarL/FixJ family response regulator